MRVRKIFVWFEKSLANGIRYADILFPTSDDDRYDVVLAPDDFSIESN